MPDERDTELAWSRTNLNQVTLQARRYMEGMYGKNIWLIERSRAVDLVYSDG